MKIFIFVQILVTVVMHMAFAKAEDVTKQYVYGARVRCAPSTRSCSMETRNLDTSRSPQGGTHHGAERGWYRCAEQQEAGPGSNYIHCTVNNNPATLTTVTNGRGGKKIKVVKDKKQKYRGKKKLMKVSAKANIQPDLKLFNQKAKKVGKLFDKGTYSGLTTSKVHPGHLYSLCQHNHKSIVLHLIRATASSVWTVSRHTLITRSTQNSQRSLTVAPCKTAIPDSGHFSCVFIGIFVARENAHRNYNVIYIVREPTLEKDTMLFAMKCFRFTMFDANCPHKHPQNSVLIASQAGVIYALSSRGFLPPQLRHFKPAFWRGKDKTAKDMNLFRGRPVKTRGDIHGACLSPDGSLFITEEGGTLVITVTNARPLPKVIAYRKPILRSVAKLKGLGFGEDSARLYAIHKNGEVSHFNKYIDT